MDWINAFTGDVTPLESVFFKYLPRLIGQWFYKLDTTFQGWAFGASPALFPTRVLGTHFHLDDKLITTMNIYKTWRQMLRQMATKVAFSTQGVNVYSKFVCCSFVCPQTHEML